MIHTLNVIEEKHCHDPEKCCNEMFKYWLNNCDPTWDKMIDALEQIQQDELAAAINRNDAIKGSLELATVISVLFNG